MSRKNVNRIMAVYDLATTQEKIDGASWYEAAHRIAQSLAADHGLTLQSTAGVISALSPRNKWKRNVIDAENLIEAFKVDPESACNIKVSTFSKNKERALKILANDFQRDEYDSVDDIAKILSGPKLNEFFNCILLRDDVCIDGHAYCIWNGGRTSLADVPSIGVKLRKEIKADYAKAAERTNTTPAVMQAVTWCAWRRIHGVSK
jgi:hypothetical protein